MITINDREVGLFYSVWAVCEFNDWIVEHPDRSYASATVQKAVIMSKAYCDVHGGKPLSVSEILNLPAYVFNELMEAVAEQEKLDSTRTVVTETVTEKNAESSAE